MTTTPAISARIRSIVGKVVHPDLQHKLSDDALLADLNLDGIDMTCIAMDVEEAWHFELRDPEIERWVTVKDIAASVERHVPAERSAA
jgi:acyl carrier protein